MDSCRTLVDGMFFDQRRYDLSIVGRYKFNKKLALWPRIHDRRLIYPVADPMTGEILFEAGHVLSVDEAKKLDSIGVNEVTIDVDGAAVKVFSNHMADMSAYVDFDPWRSAASRSASVLPCLRNCWSSIRTAARI